MPPVPSPELGHRFQMPGFDAIRTTMVIAADKVSLSA